MAIKLDIGRYGEEEARKFLKKAGYKIVASNKRESHKEIDIIATDKEYIAFVEVKTRSVEDDLYNPYGTPASAVTKRKQNNLISAARAYLRENPTDKQPRMDVVEVWLVRDEMTEKTKVVKINHIKAAY